MLNLFDDNDSSQENYICIDDVILRGDFSEEEIPFVEEFILAISRNSRGDDFQELAITKTPYLDLTVRIYKLVTGRDPYTNGYVGSAITPAPSRSIH